ncbi:MAG: DUF58 domain-containing protein [Magnetococcales bacterium]|nr:DUF58 domain-containing protein [Magnetococcales bacterium]
MTRTTQPGLRLTVEELIGLRHQARGLPPEPKRARSPLEGSHLSAFKGRGMAFSETRAYQPGDDVRHMEWRVTARTGKPHVKLFREERERAVLVWTDFRRPMFFATRGRFKVIQAARAAALAAWGATLRGDRLGGLIFSEQQNRELRPARGDRAVLNLIQELIRFPDPDPAHPDNPQAFTQALIRLRRVALPGSLIFLFSDFRGLSATDRTHLAQLARHNDLTLFFLHDPLERALPPAGGRYPVMSGSGAPRLLNVDNPRLRHEYALRFQHRLEQLTTLCHGLGALLISCSTDEESTTVLQRGFGVSPR